MHPLFDFSPSNAVDLGAANPIVYLRGTRIVIRDLPQDPNCLVSMSWPQSRRREATINGHRVHLAPACHQLLQLLLFTDPVRSVPLEELIEGMWPNPHTQPVTADIVVRVYVNRLRKLGVRIEGRPGYGYRIPLENRGRPERRQDAEIRRAA